MYWFSLYCRGVSYMFADLKLNFKFWLTVVFDICMLAMICVVTTKYVSDIYSDLFIFTTGFLILLIWYSVRVYLIDLIRKKPINN
ncbi:putative membrane protein (plasmid) [Bacillus thuringiensis serovar kurstaki]|nr:putative membrane protein [Bacillus thuringiensis serovar kurstaki]